MHGKKRTGFAPEGYAFFGFDDHLLGPNRMSKSERKGATKLATLSVIFSRIHPSLPNNILEFPLFPQDLPFFLNIFFVDLLPRMSPKKHPAPARCIAGIAARHLGASRQDLNGPVDLLIAPHQGIHHAIGRSLWRSAELEGRGEKMMEDVYRITLYTHTYIYIHTYIHTYIYIIYIYIYVCVCVYTYLFGYLFIYSFIVYLFIHHVFI